MLAHGDSYQFLVSSEAYDTCPLIFEIRHGPDLLLSKAEINSHYYATRMALLALLLTTLALGAGIVCYPAQVRRVTIEQHVLGGS